MAGADMYPTGAPAEETAAAAKPGSAYGSTVAVVAAAGPAFGDFDLDAATAHVGVVQGVDGILGVALVLELDEGKPGRVAGDPHIVEGAVALERGFNVPFRDLWGQVATVHARHDG